MDFTCYFRSAAAEFTRMISPLTNAEKLLQLSARTKSSHLFIFMPYDPLFFITLENVGQ